MGFVSVENEISDERAVKVARHVTWVGFWVNAVLGAGKVLAGVFGRSAAMVADGVHSFSDFVTDIIVLIFVGIGRKKANQEYQYGHGQVRDFCHHVACFDIGDCGGLVFYRRC